MRDGGGVVCGFLTKDAAVLVGGGGMVGYCCLVFVCVARHIYGVGFRLTEGALLSPL